MDQVAAQRRVRRQIRPPEMPRLAWAGQEGPVNAMELRCNGLDGTVVEGIVMNTERTPLDECGYAYKSLDAVLEVLGEENIAQLMYRVYPVANLKGMD